MFKLSSVQVAALQQGCIDSFTAEHRHYRDDDGNSILHLLIIHNQSTSCIQEAVTRLTVNPHLFNKQWLDPISLAIQMNRIDIAKFLLEQPILIDKEYINLILGTAFERYYDSAYSSLDNRKITAGFYASVLCGRDIHDLLAQTRSRVDASSLFKMNATVRKKYESHINWQSGYIHQQDKVGKTTSIEHLEGMQPIDFLPVRIRHVLEIFLRVQGFGISDDNLSGITPEIAKEDSAALWERRCQLSQALQEELWRVLQMFLVTHHGSFIQEKTKGDAPLELLLRTALVNGLIATIRLMKKDESLIIETGSPPHCTYLQIKKIENGTSCYEMLIHNLGLGSIWHLTKGAPYLLAHLTENAWNDQAEGSIYLHRLFSYKALGWKILRPALYDRVNANNPIQSCLVGANVLSLPAQNSRAMQEQSVDNCVAANHDAVRHFTMSFDFADWLDKEERALASEIRSDILFPRLDMNLWQNDLRLLPEDPRPPYFPSVAIRLPEYYIVTSYTEKLEERLNVQLGLVKRIAIHGAAGCGKTLLAQQYLKKYQLLYPAHLTAILLGETSDQWWSSLRDWLTSLHPELSKQLTKEPNQEKQNKLLVQWLADQLNKKNWCIILDNWDAKNGLNWTEIESLFRVGSGILLITTQDNGLFFEDERLLNLNNGFSLHESDALLDKILTPLKDIQKNLGDAESKTSLIQALNGLPLSLVQMGNYLLWENKKRQKRGKLFTCQDYKNLLDEKVKELIEKHEKLFSGKPDVPQTIQEAAVDLSLRKALQMDEDEPDLKLCHVLCLCACLASVGIPQLLLLDYLTLLLPNKTKEQIEESLVDILEAASRYSLLQYEDQFSAVDNLPCLQMHRVIQRVLRDTYWPLLVGRETLMVLLLPMMKSVVYDRFDSALNSFSFDTIRTYLPHIQAMWQGLSSRTILSGQNDMDEILAVLTFDFQPMLAKAEFSLGNYEKAESLYREILRKQINYYRTEEHLEIAKIKNNLAMVLERLGCEKEAHRLYRQALSVKSVNDNVKEHPDILSTTEFNSMDCFSLEEQEALYRKDLVARSNVYGPRHIDVASTQDNLAIVLRGLGKYAEAEELHRKALKTKEHHYGKTHFDVAMTRQSLAVVLERLERYDEAEHHHRFALQATIQHFQGSKAHIEVAFIQNNLAGVLEHLGNDEEAERLYREALATKISHFKNMAHESVARTRVNLILLLSRAGKTIEQDLFIESDESDEDESDEDGLQSTNILSDVFQDNVQVVFRQGYRFFMDTRKNGQLNISVKTFPMLVHDDSSLDGMLKELGDLNTLYPENFQLKRDERKTSCIIKGGSFFIGQLNQALMNFAGGCHNEAGEDVCRIS